MFLFENGDFFSPVWPTVHTYPVKTVTRKRSPVGEYLTVLLYSYGRIKQRFLKTIRHGVGYQ